MEVPESFCFEIVCDRYQVLLFCMCTFPKAVIFYMTDAPKCCCFACARYGDEDRIVTMVGLMQALVSVVQASQDALRSIIVGRHKFVFLVREQLILVGVVSSAESCQQMFHQLTYVYSQLLSVLTHSQLVRIFKDRRNYDLRRMLTGAEKFFNNLLDLMDHDPSFLLGAVRCLPLDSSVRDIVAQSIAQHAKVKVNQYNYAI